MTNSSKYENNLILATEYLTGHYYDLVGEGISMSTCYWYRSLDNNEESIPFCNKDN